MKRRLNSKTVRFKFNDPECFFNCLPNEILLEIFSTLSGAELRKCCSICKKWRDLISTFFDTEVVIVCDTTMSMTPTWKALIPQLESILKEKDKVRFGFVSYTDHHEGSKVVTTFPLTFLTDKLVSDLKSVRLGIGHDEPEAVLDGLYAALQLDWKPNTHKLCIMVCDSPPHGRRYVSDAQDDPVSDDNDDFPDGCPCGLSETFILTHFREMAFLMIVLYTNPKLEKMCSLFSDQVPNLISHEIHSNDFKDIFESIRCIL